MYPNNQSNINLHEFIQTATWSVKTGLSINYMHAKVVINECNQSLMTPHTTYNLQDCHIRVYIYNMNNMYM